MSLRLALAAALAASVASPLAAKAFELSSPGLSCGGHEWLTVEAAHDAGIDPKFHASMALGVRYVDLAGHIAAKDWYFGHMKEEVHRGPGISHNHFCLRGGAADLPALTRDATARVRHLLELALSTPLDRQVELLDGGILSQSHARAFARFTLLGAALHTVQDSFAHAHRTPVAGAQANDEAAFRSKGLYLHIGAAVLVPDATAGTMTHNAVYTAGEGSHHKSDQIFNVSECQLKKGLGEKDLQPHAFAALLASRDLLGVYKAAAAGDPAWHEKLDAFMAHWFADAHGKFAGYGSEFGQCASANGCKRPVIPGEPGYVPLQSGTDKASAGAKKAAESLKEKLTGHH
jgi:hypothetical protein